jgi:hypothetical protein
MKTKDERKQIEDEAMRIFDEWYVQKVKDRDKAIKKQAETVKEKDKTIEEKDKKNAEPEPQNNISPKNK